MRRELTARVTQNICGWPRSARRSPSHALTPLDGDDMTARLRCARVARGLSVVAATTAILAGCGGSAIDETAAGPGAAVADQVSAAGGTPDAATTGAADAPAAGTGTTAAATGTGAAGTAAKGAASTGTT